MFPPDPPRPVPKLDDIIIQQTRSGYWLFRVLAAADGYLHRQLAGYGENGHEASRLAQEIAARTGAQVWLDAGSLTLLLSADVVAEFSSHEQAARSSSATLQVLPPGPTDPSVE